MALASLCRQLRARNDDRIALHAFIVDHQLRPTSTQEAELVRERLANELGSS